MNDHDPAETDQLAAEHRPEPELEPERSRPVLTFRSPQLVIAILGAILDDPAPISWTGMIGMFSEQSKYTAKTIENTLGDLCQLGAIQKIGTYRDRWTDTRAVRSTVLGRAWSAGEFVPFPTNTEQETP